MQPPNQLTSFKYNGYLTFTQKEGPNTGIFISLVTEKYGQERYSEADLFILIDDYYGYRQTHTKIQSSSIHYKLIGNSPRKNNTVNSTNLTGRNGTEVDETTNVCTITPTASLPAYHTTRDFFGKYWLSESAPCDHSADYVSGTKTITGNYMGFNSKLYDVHEIPAFMSERFEGTALSTLYEAILYYGYLDNYDQSYTALAGTVWTEQCNNDSYTAISTIRTRKYFYGIEYGNRTVAPSGKEKSKHYSILMNTDGSMNHTILGYASYGVPYLIEAPSEYPPADPIDDNPDTLPDPGGDPQEITFRWETYKAIRSGRELKGL
jgi:hypothetical protein